MRRMPAKRVPAVGRCIMRKPRKVETGAERDERLKREVQWKAKNSAGADDAAHAMITENIRLYGA
jgi:hypothetical protein